MDTRDVSERDDSKMHLESIRRVTNQALQRKGQKVHDHASPEEMISQFMMVRRAMQSSHAGGSLITSQVPLPYPACSRSFTDLAAINISDMRLETHHRGNKTLLRVCTPANRMTAVMAIVEDEQGTATLLQLYFQPEETEMPAECILQPGRVCLVKEPFFKRSTDGTYSIRVDHVSDIIWLDNDDEKIPEAWRGPSIMSKTSHSFRSQGNDAVGLANWAEAHDLYSSAISTAQTAEETRLAYLNRSLTNLRLDRPEKALSDAVVEINADSSPSEEKRLFREARALYELGNIECSHASLQKLVSLFPDNQAGKKELDRTTARLREQQTGEYDFHRMYKQSKATPPLIDCATYSELVEVRASPGRGRGLFVKKAVSAGQLLLCEKAFAYAFAGGSEPTAGLMNMATGKASVGGQARLLTQLIQKAYHNPKLSSAFKDLHHGDYTACSVAECDGRPVVDTFLVERIMALNMFGAPRTSFESISAIMKDKDTGDETGKETKFATAGIWLLASRINHSCVSNCRRSFIGDMLIVRATKDIAAGTELVFSYHPPQEYQTYEETQAKFSNWGFTCDCELCQAKKNAKSSALKRRIELSMELSKAMGRSGGARNAKKAEQVLQRMAETYPAAGGCSIKLELWDPYFALGGAFVLAGDPVASLGMLVKGFEALGFDMVARASIGGEKAKLEVRRWGQVRNWTPFAFCNLFKAFEMLAPELCGLAKAYFETAFTMIVGDPTRARELFPELY
ncbi:hypothetical protein CDD80_1193 [Ophiocordyceps camponoti-rufipedis]|uniref:SET domain-containing protein n=1 Tax=Ophiocordyceps camponoti-rufipedis TaxID=2004952 RepID=A0A2C5Z4S1_9HYPO|nr:hypothetical protein CDD80_1193 [Ophiocordyceps camponoti-rufipedis]